MAKKQYMSMQEELAARRAAREEGYEGGSSSRKQDSPKGSFRSFLRDTETRTRKAANSRFKKTGRRFSDESKKEKNASAGAAPRATIIESGDEAAGHFSRRAEEKKSVVIGQIAVGVVLSCVALMAVFIWAFDDGWDDDWDNSDFPLDKTATHQEVLEYLDEEVYVDWDIDPREIRAWSDENLKEIIGDRLRYWKPEVSREYIIIRVVYESTGNMDAFSDMCYYLTEDIEEDLSYNFDSYPSIVFEARKPPAGSGKGVISDDTELTFLMIDGDEYFSLEEFAGGETKDY